MPGPIPPSDHHPRPVFLNVCACCTTLHGLLCMFVCLFVHLLKISPEVISDVITNIGKRHRTDRRAFLSLWKVDAGILPMRQASVCCFSYYIADLCDRVLWVPTGTTSSTTGGASVHMWNCEIAQNQELSFPSNPIPCCDGGFSGVIQYQFLLLLPYMDIKQRLPRRGWVTVDTPSRKSGSGYLQHSQRLPSICLLNP